MRPYNRMPDGLYHAPADPVPFCLHKGTMYLVLIYIITYLVPGAQDYTVELCPLCIENHNRCVII